jgi:hypothetical protein
MPARRSWPPWARPAGRRRNPPSGAFALVSADALDWVLGAWLWTKAVQAGGRLVIAIDGKAVRGARAAESIRRPGRRSPDDRRHAHAARHRAGHPRPGRRLRDDRQGQHAGPVRAAQEAALGLHPLRLAREHGPRPPGPPQFKAALAPAGPGSTVPPRSRTCAAWPSASRAWTDTPTSPPPTAITPATRSGR